MSDTSVKQLKNTYIYYTNIEENQGLRVRTEIIKNLPCAILDRLEQTTHEDLYLQRLAGWLTLLTGLNRLSIDAGLLEKLQFSDTGRPYIQSNPVYFNISHSGKFAGCALSRHHSVGLDIERIRPVAQLDRIKSMLNMRSDEQVRKMADKQLKFFQQWTRTESVIKAHGGGFYIDVGKLEWKEDSAMIEGRRYFLAEWKLHSGYVAHVAAAGIRPVVVTEEVKLV